MEFIGFPKIPRYSRECIITEKIDGTNSQILISTEHSPEALIGLPSDMGYFYLFAGSRNRWLSVDKDNHGFARWTLENADELVKLGPGRHFGEWWGQGINRGYGLKEKRFSLFNVHRWGDDSVRPACCHVVPKLSWGMFTTELIEETLKALKELGSQAAPGFMKPEEIVIYHVTGNLLFKKTVDHDDEPKGVKE